MSDESGAIEKLRQAFLSLTQQLLNLDAAIADIRSALHVLRISVATQMSPDDPSAALKQLVHLEKMVAATTDPNRKARKEALDVAAALQEWIRNGRRPPDS
jgi:hypothetical protein